MKLIKKKASEGSSAQARFAGVAVDRRTFLRRSGLALGGAVVATALPPMMMKRARAEINPPKEGASGNWVNNLWR